MQTEICVCNLTKSIINFHLFQRHYERTSAFRLGKRHARKTDQTQLKGDALLLYNLFIIITTDLILVKWMQYSLTKTRRCNILHQENVHV